MTLGPAKSPPASKARAIMQRTHFTPNNGETRPAPESAEIASAKQYRQFRDECLRWAQAARNEAERDIYLQLAKTWHEAELRIEQSLALIAGSKALFGRFKK
jgi:hypothetical protein